MSTVSRWYNIDIQYVGPMPVNKFTLRVSQESKLSDITNSLKKQGAHIFLQGKTITIMK